MASGEEVTLPEENVDSRESKELHLSPMEAQNLPGYLPWENDLEMVSKFLDRKVSLV